MGIVKTLFRMDGWQNLLSGFGSKKDKGAVSEDTLAGFHRITPVMLGILYRTNAEIRNAVDMPAEDMTRRGFEVEGDDGTLYKAFQALQGPAVFKQALQHTRLYGGAIVVMDVEGAGKWDTPWNPKNGGKIRRLVEYPRTRVNLAGMEVSKVPGSLYFDDFEMWSIFGASGTPFNVHASRILVFKSECRVDILEPGYTDYERYWGLSEVYRGLDDAYGFGTTKQGTSHLMKECSVAKYRLSNLENLVAENDWASLDNRLEAIDMQKSVVNGVFLGEGEEYTRENVTFSGVPEIWDRQMMAVSGAFRVPVTKMFGRSAAGMNATGEGDDDNYNAYIAGLQMTQELPPLTYLMGCLNVLLKVVKSENGTELPRLTIDFNPLSTRDTLKDAQVREIMSRADRNYIEAGILNNEDIVRNRFQGGYKVDTTVEEYTAPDLTMEGAE